MKRAILFVMMVLLAAPAFAQTSESKTSEPKTELVQSIEGTGAVSMERIETLPTLRPEAELDSETRGLLEQAESLAEDDPAQSVRIALALLLSHDPFTRRQREAIASETAPILRKAAQSLRSKSVEDAAFASDAAWTAGGRENDPEHAKLLMELAEARVDSNKPEALWLARRAMKADPNNAVAVRLDRQLSRNTLLGVGWAVLIAGAGGIVAGAVLAGAANGQTATLQDGTIRTRSELDALAATRDRTARLSTISYLGGVGLMISSGIVWAIGQRGYKPTSPSFLPAVRD